MKFPTIILLPPPSCVCVCFFFLLNKKYQIEVELVCLFIGVLCTSQIGILKFIYLFIIFFFLLAGGPAKTGFN